MPTTTFQKPKRPLRGGREKRTRSTSKQAPAGLGPHPAAQALSECSLAVNACWNYCTGKGGRHVAPRHLACLVDCAEMCYTTADFVSRGSDYAGDLKAVCADLVKCAEESCEDFQGDATMMACADVCRRTFATLTGHP